MSRARLNVLDAEVEGRTAAVRAEAEDWPCRSGCSDCCKSLGAPMLLSEEEWARLEEGIATLPADEGAAIVAGLDALEGVALAGGPVGCPILDLATGRCRLYAHRPLPCRIHGYYSTREGGYWCERIQARVEAGGAEGVVFGRHEAVTQRAEQALGPPLSWSERRR